MLLLVKSNEKLHLVLYFEEHQEHFEEDLMTPAITVKVSNIFAFMSLTIEKENELPYLMPPLLAK